jgi:hypothetical protein
MGLFNTIGFNYDNSECEIREAYESSDAALLHQSNLREQLRILLKMVLFTQ